MLVRSKLVLNFGLMSLLMLAIGTGGLFSSWMYRNQMRGITTKAVPSMQSLTEIQGGLWDAVMGNGDSDARFAELENEIAVYQKLAGRDEKAVEFAGNLRGRILELREQIPTATPEVLAKSVGDISEFIRVERREEILRWEGILRRGGHIFVFTSWVNGLLILGGLLVSMLSGLALARRIGDSLKEAYESALAVSGGDLRRRMKNAGDDEIGLLAGAFNQMVDTLVQADAEITREVDERIRAEQKAQAAARAKSDFLAHMSHEFRTPLNGILGYSQVLLLDKGLSERNHTVVQSLRKSGENLLELINDVLDLAKIEARRMHIQQSRFYLQEFLESLREAYAEHIQRKGLEFRLLPDTDVPEDVLADPIRLRQVLVNLVGNAVKFTDTGRVELRVSRVEKGLRFGVRDTGIGIAPEHLDQVLQPFMQVDHKNRKNHGTGLGLSISTRLVEMMGGTGLKVESEVGKGTEFWFELPQPEGEHRRLVLAPRRIKGYRGDRRTLLFAESTRETFASMAPLLRKTGFEVHEFTHADELISHAQGIFPDAIIVDLHLLGGGALAVMKAFQDVCEKDERELPPFLLFSDNRREKDREQALAAGASEFLPKPIRYGDLLKALELMLGLEWIEGDTNEHNASDPTADLMEGLPVVPPPVEELEALLALARAGNVRQIREQVESLRGSRPELRVFCSTLLTLCATYQINAIQELLRKHLPSPEDSTP